MSAITLPYIVDRAELDALPVCAIIQQDGDPLPLERRACRCWGSPATPGDAVDPRLPVRVLWNPTWTQGAAL